MIKSVVKTSTSPKKKAIITGITGQDGSFLAELLIEKGYEVHGIIRRSSIFNTGRIDHLHAPQEGKDTKIFTHYADLTDSSSITNLIHKIQPDEIYNLGAQSHVKISFDIPEYTGDSTGISTTRILEAIRIMDKKVKFYQASSSEMFGNASEKPQKETTAFYPRSPYACAKVYSYWITRNYREAYDLFAVNGILFNHESERRGKNFVTRKITYNLAMIKEGKLDCLYLGNLDSKRDWGHAKDYVEAMWMIMQHDKPDDYVVSTGETHTVREFVEEAAKILGYNIVWEGSGDNEIGRDKNTGRVIVRVDPKFYRPTEVDYLLGDYSKIKKEIGWEPKIKFKQLVKIMVESDLKMVRENDQRF